MSDADENWLGHSNPDEHRTVGYRAWNYVGGEQSAYMERAAVYALAEVEVLRAQVQAVRECTGGFCDVDRETLYDALDGSL